MLVFRTPTFITDSKVSDFTGFLCDEFDQSIFKGVSNDEIAERGLGEAIYGEGRDCKTGTTLVP